jgi:hypothetical protein
MRMKPDAEQARFFTASDLHKTGKLPVNETAWLIIDRSIVMIFLKETTIMEYKFDAAVREYALPCTGLFFSLKAPVAFDETGESRGWGYSGNSACGVNVGFCVCRRSRLFFLDLINSIVPGMSGRSVLN